MIKISDAKEKSVFHRTTCHAREEGFGLGLELSIESYARLDFELDAALNSIDLRFRWRVPARPYAFFATESSHLGMLEQS